MTQQLSDYQITVRHWRHMRVIRDPLPVRCDVYKRLLRRWGYERVRRHLDCIADVLDRAEIQAMGPKDVEVIE